MGKIPWKQYSGPFVVLVGLVRTIWWLVGKAGDIDFLATRWKTIMAIIAAPWFSLVVLAIGLGLIYWNSKRKELSTTLLPTESSEWIDHFDRLFGVEINQVSFRNLWNDAGTQVNTEPFLLFNIVTTNNTPISLSITGCMGRATIDGDVCTLPAEMHPGQDQRLDSWRYLTPTIKQPLLTDKGRDLVAKIEAGALTSFSLTSINLLVEGGGEIMPSRAMSIRVGFDIDPTGINLEHSSVSRRSMVLKNP